MIKFPTQINPARLTVQLRRVDSIIASPLTNIQQVASRGNPAWVWTYEYVDLSASERDIVQAFLLKAKGPVNTFKVSDPGDYEIRGTISDWIDVFNDKGSFSDPAGSGSTNVNSQFTKGAGFNHHITDEKTVRFEWRSISSGHNLGYANAVLDAGKAYAQRIKNFNGEGGRQFGLAVGSGASGQFISSAPTPVASDDAVTAPFVTDASTYDASVVEWTGNSPKIGDFFEQADYRLARCALVSNSEQLFTRSDNLGHGDWLWFNVLVDSGYWDASPIGVTSGGWIMYNNTNVNTEHSIDQVITKPMTRDLYTLGFYCRQVTADMDVQLEFSDTGGNNQTANFDLTTGLPYSQGGSGFFERPHAKGWPVGSDTYRCQLTVSVTSLNNLKGKIHLVNSAGNIQYTGNGSAGVEIFGASLRKGPFLGEWLATVTDTITGAVAQTGSRLRLDGFDAGDIIKSGQRFEIVNRFNNVNSSYFERSEFKRITKEAIAGLDGGAFIEFDPPIRNAPATDRSNITGTHRGETMHNPVIFHKPELKARLVAGTIQYIDKSLMTTDIVFDVIEDMIE
jgi:hypothetical protein